MRIRFNDTNIEEVTMFDFTESCNADGTNKQLTIFAVYANQKTGDYIADVCINRFPTFQDAKKYCINILDNLMITGFYDMRKDVEAEIIDLW